MFGRLSTTCHNPVHMCMQQLQTYCVAFGSAQDLGLVQLQLGQRMQKKMLSRASFQSFELLQDSQQTATAISRLIT